MDHSFKSYRTGRRNALIAGVILPGITVVARLMGMRSLSRTTFLAANAALLYPSLKRNCTFFGPIVTRFHTEKKEVWLTIDDGPDPFDTPEILKILKSHGAKASFFCIGKKVERYPELSRQIIQEGHAIENHSYDHPIATFWAALPQQIRSQIRRAQRAIHKITDIPPRYFRSPVGMTNSFVHPEVMRDGLRIVGWSCAGFDGVRRSSRQVMQCLLPGIKPGAIVLLHEGGNDGESSSRVKNLELLLQYLTQRGYHCIIPEANSLIDHEE